MGKRGNMTNAKLNGFSVPIFTAKDVAQIPVLELTFPENLSNEDKRWQKKKKKAQTSKFFLL